MNNRKRLILSGLACLSLLGGGGASAAEKQRSNSAPRLVARNTDLVPGSEYNAAVKKANNMGLFASLLGLAGGAGVAGLSTYTVMNEKSSKLKDEIKKLQVELEKEKEKNKKPVESNDENDKNKLLDRIKELEKENEVLRIGYREYQKATKDFFDSLKERVRGMGKAVQYDVPVLDAFNKTENAFWKVLKKILNANELVWEYDDDINKFKNIKLEDLTLTDLMELYNIYQEGKWAVCRAYEDLSSNDGEIKLEAFAYNLENLCNGDLVFYISEDGKERPDYVKKGLWLKSLLPLKMSAKFGLKSIDDN